jgi:hypothetical protein
MRPKFLEDHEVRNIPQGMTAKRPLYEGRLKSNAHMLVEREQNQIARSGKKYMKVRVLYREG